MPARSMPVTTAVSAAFGHMRCDRDMAALLEVYDSLRPVRFNARTDVRTARQGPSLADAVRRLTASLPGLPEGPQVATRDLFIEGAAGQLHARVYTPAHDERPLPVVLYFHDGGWATGSIDQDDAQARGIAAHSGATVVSVGYRLAPEHPFPASWEDAMAAYEWVRTHAALLQGDAERIALAGEGSGANLALATALSASGLGLPMPAHLLAICPVAQTGTNTASYIEHALARPLGRAKMAWCFDRLVRDPRQLKDPRLNPCLADLAGLPPVTLVSAQLDPLRVDAQRLHDALYRARVPVQWQEFQGVSHGFFGAAAVVARARQAQQFAGTRLAEALIRPAQPAHTGPLRQLAALVTQTLATPFRTRATAAAFRGS